jgi:hypothetical protein
MQIFFKPLALDLLSVLGDGTIIEELVALRQSAPSTGAERNP